MSDLALGHIGVTTDERFGFKIQFSLRVESQSITEQSSVLGAYVQLKRTVTSETEYYPYSSSATHWRIRFVYPNNIRDYSFTPDLDVWQKTELTIPHNKDGTCSFPFEIYVYTDWGESSYKGSIYDVEYTVYDQVCVLPSITAPANIVSISTWNDEENPVMQYATHNQGAASYTIMAAIGFSSGADDLRWFHPTVNGTSFTFELSDEQRTLLRKNFEQAATSTVYFILYTFINDEMHYDIMESTVSLVNYLPTLSPTIVDTNPQTVQLTGDNTKFIKFFSNASFTTGATARKEATIVSQNVVCGSKRVDDTPAGTITGIDSNIFYFKTRDSRGYIAEKYVFADTVAYTKPTCNIRSLSLSGNGDLTFTISGNYFNSNFGAKDNSLEFEIGYRKDGGDIVWQPFEATPTFNGNTYTLTHTLSGFDNTAQYSVTFNIIDELSNAQSPFRIAGSVSIFDWGKTDFRHNTDVYHTYGTTIHTENTYGDDITVIDPCSADNQLIIGKGNYDAGIGSTDIWGNTVNINGKSFGENKILWSGASHMDGSQSIQLSESISSQISGIILVFSGYDTDASQAKDASINTFFVSKKQVELFPSVGHTFILGIDAGFSGMAAKYLYFTDTTISGHSDNTGSGTNSGITYNNSNYVLRYVIGV